MGRLKQRKQKSEAQQELRIRRAILAFQQEKYPSIRKTAEAFGLAYSTLRRRLSGGESRVKAHVVQQLCTPAEEKAIVRWILKLEEWGFPPRIAHVKEGVAILKGIEWDEDSKVGKNWITRFLDRHPYLVSKLSSQFDKKRIKASDPEIIRDHFNKLLQFKRVYRITDATSYNMDEKGFRQGISDQAKVICLRRGRGMTGKLATDGNREMITVVEAILSRRIAPRAKRTGSGDTRAEYA